MLQNYWQVYGLGAELVGEYKLVSNSPVLQKEYGQRNGQLLVIAEAANSNCQWLVADQLGTPRILSDQTGNLSAIKRRDYLPFGEDLLAGIGHRATTNGYEALVGQAPRQQFTSKERDAETGLDYFEARYYSATMGRFTSPDEFTGGPDELYDFADDASDNPLFYASLIEPQSLNKYQYAYNNPLRYTDPDGHGIETLWDAANVVMGVVSLVKNVKSGNYGAAVVDAVGVVLDGAATAVPFLPGGAGTAIKAVRGGAAVAKAVNRTDNIVDGVKAADKTGGALTAANNGKNTAVKVAKTDAPQAAKQGGLGSYTNTHQSGTQYAGKGDYGRSQSSAKRVAKKEKDPLVSTDHTTASSKRESFKQESRRLDSIGGVKSPQNYNKVESPGKKYRKEDGEN